MGGWVDGWMGGWVDGWMGGRVDGWMGGRVSGWMGGWVDGWACLLTCLHIYKSHRNGQVVQQPRIYVQKGINQFKCSSTVKLTGKA